MIVSYWIHVALPVLFALYWINTTVYALWLKKVVIIDVFMIAIGFVLRGIMGMIVVHAAFSAWFVIMIFFGSLFLGFFKRYQESMVYTKDGLSSRKNIEEYNESFLIHILSVLTSFLLVAYAFYTFQSIQGEKMIVTIPIVAFGIIRFYYNIIFLKKHVISIENIIIQDRWISGSIALYLLVVI